MVTQRTHNSETLILAMAADLVRFRATGSEPDAIRSLLATRNYTPFDVVQLVGKALTLARQPAAATPPRPANSNLTDADLLEHALCFDGAIARIAPMMAEG